MSGPLTRRALVLVLTVVFLAVSTAALAHGHPDGKAADESHCALCIAVHTTTSVVVTSTVSLHFAPVQTYFIARSESFVLPLVQSFATQDRAPPQL